ncbi:MAG TPA: radical SAM protein, partial [Patescibacteria group bacterium]|nr:radical SAM protein [Patescibacteria group bacterium]
MKPSRYNRIFQAEDGTWLAFNSWSTALAAIESEDLSFIQALLAGPGEVACDTPRKRELREHLVRGHFLIEDEVDELAQMKVDILKDRFRTDMMALTIAPTLDCNFRCDYCYEEHLRVTMSAAVQQALVRFTEQRCATIANLQVCWFGGEPMLPTAFPVVEQLSRRFLDLTRSRGIGYAAEIVTNGYFLDREKVDLLKTLGVQTIQVTLDGPPVIHDRRRILLGGQGTFWRIMDNMKQVAGMLPIKLRINVDRRNAGATIDLLEVLAREGIADKVHPYIAQVTPGGTACGNIVESCFNGPDFAMTAVELYREAAR